MKAFAALILISFVGIAVFGFSGLTSHESLFSRCVTATIPGGMPCGGSHELGMDILHADIFQGFSNAILALASLLLVAFCLHLFGIAHEKQGFLRAWAFAGSGIQDSQAIKHSRWSILNQQHPARAV